ncbi:hypothetical protein AG1IA_02670 [Rhizoctonia solani AG-1 IA]|uniref:Uncharacterized protein n=1 Tax=Thanatephorus cucumeris (strain AG1-IA) TaxID=983506 RepID=L8X2S6_THACA|nr:hypothetical protein AG1IA_02670 [Rhizoctonia solani AG-1 IA]
MFLYVSKTRRRSGYVCFGQFKAQNRPIESAKSRPASLTFCLGQTACSTSLISFGNTIVLVSGRRTRAVAHRP